MDSLTAAATTRRRVLLALAGSLALHAILLAGLNLRPLPEDAFDAAARRIPLAVVLGPLAPLAVAPRVEPAASRVESKTSLPPRTLLRSDRLAPPAAAEQDIQTPAVPHFDLDALRLQAREQGQGKRKESASAIPPQNLGQTQPTPLLERDTPLSHAIAKASRPDCKTAYAGAGLFALPLLLYDTATESGCQW